MPQIENWRYICENCGSVKVWKKRIRAGKGHNNGCSSEYHCYCKYCHNKSTYVYDKKTGVSIRVTEIDHTNISG